LGILVFTIGNLCNFAAFNFAAQSLLAPLGSVSLIVNVILAPLLNGEIWTWKDILGIIFIISGSTIVVIFAGFPPKDYNLCVLLKLFQQTSTIIFLTVTCLLIAMLFITIVIVERNLDLKENSTVIIEQTLNDGRLIAVTPNPHNGADLPGIII
jgi:drug/metabolite transporter (DMT)-like permease